MSDYSRARIGIFNGLIGFGLTVFSGAAVAQQAPGWYAALEGFYSDVEDIDGTLTITQQGTQATQNSCAIPAPGVAPQQDPLTGECGFGDDSLPGIPGSTSVSESTIVSKGGAGGGLSFGYLFDGGFRPELNIRYSENDLEEIRSGGQNFASNDTTIRAARAMLNFWYDIDLGRVSPYFGVGFGIQNTEFSTQTVEVDDDTTAFQAGAGIAFWFSNATALSLDYRFLTAEDPTFDYSLATDTDVTRSLEGEYKAHLIGASFRYSFGGQFADSDGDGVFDRKDKCPNTPKEAQVYPDGCPVDLDQDGVADYLDKCPNTPPGTPVNNEGCAFDSDGDGVPDHLDQCPGTPSGAKVDAKGCPLDSDGDGVADHLDQCPNTPPGVAVNAQGCSLADSDGDGIPDHLDKCPSSDLSIKVGPDGCPLDSDGDGIPDHLDQCPNTPPGLKILPDGCALVGDCRRPRAGEAVDANGCAIDQRFVLRGVKFEFDSDRLTAPAKLVLDSVADTLVAYPTVVLEVQGHTDSLGSDGYNLGLSERRSLTVQKYLAARGIDSTRLRPVGYGESAPIADNSTEEGREENRRVEFRVIE